MVIKIYWTDFAKSELQKIFEFYRPKAGLRITGKLVEGIVSATDRLHQQPLIGQQEEMLIARIEGFRYLVYRNYKIIYWINSEMNSIEIVDVFDTRQNPVKIKRV